MLDGQVKKKDKNHDQMEIGSLPRYFCKSIQQGEDIPSLSQSKQLINKAIIKSEQVVNMEGSATEHSQLLHPNKVTDGRTLHLAKENAFLCKVERVLAKYLGGCGFNKKELLFCLSVNSSQDLLFCL